MKKIKKHINVLLELAKVRITFFVAVTTSIGYLFYSKNLSIQLLVLTTGVFLLASGSSALNHYQEKETDALMLRTKSRPIPSGKISAQLALLFAFILVLFGSAIIYFSSNFISLLLGWLALIWYNFIYTPLKKVNALAVVPGSLIGAIPPVIGWTAAGGGPLDFEIIALALFFFIWQIPHFWLLLLIYSNDYERAGFPTLTRIFSNQQLSRITYVWIAALSTWCLLIPAIEITANKITVFVLCLLGILLLWKTKGILSRYIERRIFRNAFISINLYVLAVILSLSLDKLFLQEL
ncbi:protoheme IX farnesyltransferase [Melioribacteraceae bacterium 4301-Me]|uniref:protoheme IX farnesyltransferase n=1 Tax=Pyranulibacter aquaticus TaxID=3163344 RepID=UPI003596E0E9